jgi:hypothetical protein
MSNGNGNNGRRNNNGLAAIVTMAAGLMGFIAGIMTWIMRSIFTVRRRKKQFKKMKHYDDRLLNEMA